MPQLLLEIFSEEIPARMQAKAEADLGAAVTAALDSAGLNFGEVETLSGPRRLTLIIEDVATKSEDVREERKGPKVGAPEKAVEGFMRGAGLSSIDQAEVRSDPKKGDFYVAVIETSGRKAEDILAEAIPTIIRNFHWPKSMRWGEGDLRWVRPLQRVTCLFGGDVVPFELEGLKSGNEVEGHRIHGRGPFNVTDANSYRDKLERQGHVMLSREERREKIEKDANKVCSDAGLELVEDRGLLEEVTGLAEWPVVLLGKMDPNFLDLPDEVIQLSMRVHQKYFAVRDPKTGQLAPNFVVVANVDAKDGGEKIAEGNSRVLSARLNDGRFFWENDLATPLETMGEKLSTIDFKKELGTIADKVERVAALARELAPKVGADPDLAERAARLSKSDLVSEMVYEFPELQGVMGRYYALKQGEPEAVADAIRDHYKPQGPSDAVPTAPVSIAVALADKLDTLVGFWTIDEKPTGSKDPFALRRAALGVVRIILENEVRVDLEAVLSRLLASPAVRHDLSSFIATRLEQALRSEGIRYDIVNACFSAPDRLLKEAAALADDVQMPDMLDRPFGEYDLFILSEKAKALTDFLATEDGANLVAGFKRATNILKAEEKKDGTEYQGTVNSDLLVEKEEKDLFAALKESEAAATDALEREAYGAAMSALSELRGPIDAFFDQVTVNADDVAVRQNRLYLLSQIRSVLGRVADFTKIEG